MKVGIQVPFQDNQTVGVVAGDDINDRGKSQTMKGLVSPAEEVNS